MIASSKYSVGMLVVSVMVGAQASAVELASNGGFETGDTTDWVSFPTVSSSFTAITDDPKSGSYAGRIFNDAPASAAVVKQANVGIGVVTPGADITISFWGRGAGEAGGVQFAELFSELDGGGTSSAEILGGAPLFLTDQWQFFTFDATAGPDVSGGITLQFTATTGGAIGSTAETVIDDVSISVVPEPAALTALALGGLLALRRRR